MARYKGAKPAPAFSRKPVSQSTSFGGTVDLKAKSPKPKTQPAPARSKPSLLTAAQIEKDCPVEVQDLGRRLAAHYDKLIKCEDKAEQHKIAIGQLLAQAKEACDAGGFAAFRKRFCPNLGKSRAHELLLIASGKKTIDEVKTATRERVRKHRAAKAAAPKPSVTVTDAALPEADAEPEAKPNGKTNDDDVPKTEPTVEQSGAEVKRLKALKAKINANCENDAKVDPKVSADAASKFRSACEALLPKMNADDLQGVIDHFAEVVEVPANELMPDLRRVQLNLKIAKAEITALKRQLAGKLPPRESRAAAWSRLASEAVANIEELIGYQGEFQEARDGQPDGLQDGPFAQKCDAVCDIDLESALGAVQEAESADLPLGFGRD